MKLTMVKHRVSYTMYQFVATPYSNMNTQHKLDQTDMYQPNMPGCNMHTHGSHNNSWVERLAEVRPALNLRDVCCMNLSMSVLLKLCVNKYDGLFLVRAFD